ncbi:NACHT domain-containing protein [Actinoplanes xinjiangensis]|uniref:NACHT domain-containing protein n=1 Tax=Actinoplanes xinjiangensis TaxID=512350 RepID=UPI00342DAB1A
MYSRQRVLWTVIGAFGAALAVVALLPLAPDRFRDVADQVGSILGGVNAMIGLPAAVLATWALSRRGRAAAPEDPVEALALLVRRQWTPEAAYRGLRESTPLRIRWHVTTRAVAVPPDDVSDLRSVRVTRLLLAGDVVDLARTFRELRYQRLVILGAPGSGKTSAAVLMIGDLLESRAVGAPVPVLFDIGDWAPSREHFVRWLSRGLAEQYGLSPLDDLVGDGKIFAVLDGFDEMPEGERGPAIAALNELVDLPVVLLSRAGEFERAVVASGCPLVRAVAVELEPLTPSQVAGYLPAAQAGVARWEAVTESLAKDPDGPLATALSNPLLAYLARAIYRHPDAEPADLVGSADRGAIERHLIEGYLPVVYRDRGPSGAMPHTATRYPPGRAEEWIRSLAELTQRQGLHEFAWWRMEGSTGWVSRAVRIGVGLLLASVPTVITMALFGPVPGVLLCSVIVLSGCLSGRPVGAAPRRVDFDGRRLLMALAGGLVFALPSAMAFALAPILGRENASLVVLILVVVSVGISREFWREVVAILMAWRWRGRPPFEAVGRLRIRDADGISFALMVGFPLFYLIVLMNPSPDRAVAANALFGLVWILIAGVPVGLVYGLAVAVVRVVPAEEMWDPDRALRSDRAAFFRPPLLVGLAVAGLAGSVVAVATWLAGRPLGLVGESAVLIAGTVLVCVFLVWVMVPRESAWVAFTALRLESAARGRLPWRLMPFLADAAGRGVLRRNGAVYQFRHERLRAYLAHSGAGGVRRLE